MPEPRLQYINHLGQAFDFDKKSIWPLSEELYDFDIDYEVSNSRVTGHNFPDKEIPLEITMDTDDSARDMNRLYRVCMPDVKSDTPGRLYDAAWYVECFLKKSEKRYWYRNGEMRTYTLSLLVPNPIWTRDIKNVFSTSTVESDLALSFPFDYPHAYGGETPIKSILVNGISKCDCRIDIYGHVESPTVTIGNNTYHVEIGVPEGAVLTIDTRAATVEITTNDGTVIDVFSASPDATPGSGQYIFEQLEPGYLPVSWDGSFKVGITVYEQLEGEKEW